MVYMKSEKKKYKRWNMYIKMNDSDMRKFECDIYIPRHGYRIYNRYREDGPLFELDDRDIDQIPPEDIFVK